MAVNIELVCDNIITQLQGQLRPQLANVVAATDAKISLSTPGLNDYFLGEPGDYRALSAPAVFIIPNRTRFPAPGSAVEWNTIQKMNHDVWVTVVVEGTTVDELTRACMRYADAVVACLHDQDVTAPSNITARSIKVMVVDIDYGAVFISKHPQQKPFRKDVTVGLDLLHWDSLLPMAGGPPPAPVLTATTIIASVSDFEVASTSPTAVLTATPSVGGNFIVHLYYRVTVSATDLTLTLAWTDASGAQQQTIATGSQSPGSNTVAPTFINAMGGNPITVTATAGLAGQVFISGTIEAV
jgi:hypothetical protein